MFIQADIVTSIAPSMPSNNPFFSGQHKRRSCLPVKVGGTPPRYDHPSPLRIVKRKARQLSTIEGSPLCETFDRNQAAALLSDSRQPNSRQLSGTLSTMSVVRNPNILSRCSSRTHRKFSDSSLESLPNSGDSSLIVHKLTRESITGHTSTRNTSLGERQSGASISSNDVRTGHEQVCCTLPSMQSVLPQVLAPHIVVTTDTDLRYDGREYVWAAIEISGKLSHTYPTETLVADGASASDMDDCAIDRRLGMLVFDYNTIHLKSDRSVLQVRMPLRSVRRNYTRT